MKIILVHQINKFYKTFAEVLGYKLTIKVKHLNDKDLLSQILYDISEALEGYDSDEPFGMFDWLTKLFNKVATLYDTPKKNHTVAITVVLIVLALASGYLIGRQHTIANAELVGITEEEYHIDFGGSIHTYEGEC